jgi:hypothetical protein
MARIIQSLADDWLRTATSLTIKAHPGPFHPTRNRGGVPVEL